jgi:hypothetical protein
VSIRSGGWLTLSSFSRSFALLAVYLFYVLCDWKNLSDHAKAFEVITEEERAVQRGGLET